MYGMVNQALKDLIVQSGGGAAWLEISRLSNQSPDDFLTLRAYEDSITYEIVSAACRHLNRPVEEFLFAFGQFWVQFALKSKYREILQSSATDLFSMLRSLDKMHYEIARSLTELRPPSFRVQDIDAKSVYLYYYSDRPGLADFVRGLVCGLGEIYSVLPTTTVIEASEAPRRYIKFLVQLP